MRLRKRIHVRRWLRATALGLAAVATGAALAAPKEAQKLPRTDGWIECRTDHFTLYSNASAARTRKLAVQLERFRQALGRITRGFELDSRVPTSTFVFRNDSTYVPYKLDGDGDEMNVSGYFLARPFHNYITLDASAGSKPMRVVYHEFFHAVMDASLGSLPPWLSEGLAEYFSTFKDREATAVVEVGHPIDEHLAWLAQHGMIEWDTVFSTTASSATYYDEATRQGSFYAQSWLLVHYLNATDERSKALSRYLSLLRSGTQDERAFAEAFGMPRDAIGAAVEEYGETGSNFVWWDLGEGFGEVEVALRDLEAGEVLFRLGELLAQRGQAEAATSHLSAAAAAGWPAGPVQTAQAVATYYSADPEVAEVQLRKALDAGPDTAEPYVLLAGLLFDRFLTTPAATRHPGTTPSAVLESRRLLQNGLARDADEFNALWGLARTYLFEVGDVGPGIAAVERTRERRPLDMRLAQTQASLLARDGQVERAWSVVVTELQPRNPELAEQTLRYVLSAVTFAAMRRAEMDDRDGALALLDAAIETIPGAERTARLQRMREVLAEGGRIVFEETPSTEAQGPVPINEFNRAARLASAGEHAESLEILDKLVADCSDEQICELARESAARLRALVERNQVVERLNEAIALANGGDRRGAIEKLRVLEQQVQDPELLARVQDLLRQLGARVGKKK